MKQMITVTTILFSGLMAGLFFSYACSVNLGLHHLPDAEYVKAMQHINVEIQNVYFLSVFCGLLVLLPVSAWFAYNSADKSSFVLVLAAALLYVGGVFGVTAAGNIPLNNQLAALQPDISVEALSAFRTRFETQWGKFHLIRTAASVLSFLLLILSLVLPARQPA